MVDAVSAAVHSGVAEMLRCGGQHAAAAAPPLQHRIQVAAAVLDAWSRHLAHHDEHGDLSNVSGELQCAGILIGICRSSMDLCS